MARQRRWNDFVPDAVRQPRQAWRGFKISRTAVGRGVFAARIFTTGDIVGEITGQTIDDPDYTSRYAFDLEDGRQLEPAAPFRFVNHSCDPNCSFEVIDVTGADSRTQRQIMLFAIYDIGIGEELTIDYNWPKSYAIPCKCKSVYCRGWIVGEQHLPSSTDS